MKGWQIFFWVAAFYNWAVGVPLFIAPGALETITGPLAQTDLALAKITGALIVCFGIVYAIVARDPARFRPVVWAGLVGKVGIALVYLPDWLNGTVPSTTVAMVLGDLGFCAVFLFFLFRPVPKKGFQPDKPAG